MEEQDCLVISMDRRRAQIGVPRRRQSSTIYKVLETIREQDPASYNPKMVSIGPFHHGNPAFDSTQQLKWEFLSNLLGRHPQNSVDKYIRQVRSLEEDARCCYSIPVVPESNAFVEMLVLDGCFIIEFLLKSKENKVGEHFPESWTLSFLKNDLLLLENQIPFEVLQCIYKSTVIPDFYDLTRNLDPEQLMDLVVPYFFEDDPLFNADVHHLLHFYQSFLLPTIEVRPTTVSANSFGCCPQLLLPETPHTAPSIIQSATELYEAGVRFELYKAGVRSDLNKSMRRFIEVTFRLKDGIMEIPLLSIHDMTIPLFRNLVAFEQCCPRFGSHITFYIYLMDNLINIPEDVALLKRSGVLESQLGDNEEVSKFFNGLLKGAFLDHNSQFLVELFKDVKLYSGKPYHRWRAMLVRKYFSNPWSIISLIGVLVILYLTLIQALFAVLSYFLPPK